MRLGTIRQGTFLEIDSQDPRDSFDHAAAAEREGAPNTVISKSSRTESQEDILPSVPHNRILLRQDLVSRVAPWTRREMKSNFSEL